MLRKHKKILTNISLSLISIILVLLFFEITVRLLDISSGYDYPTGLYQEDELLGYSMAPNFKGKFIKQEFETDISTNSHGLRDIEYSNKKDNDFRILALGDSFTWGAYGTELNDTFLKILEKKLNENSRNLNYQVINAGIPGYGTKKELLYLVSRGVELEPDMVILNFFVGNDFLDSAEEDEVVVKNGILTRVTANEVRSFLLLHFHSYRIIEKGLINTFSGFIEKNIRGKLQQDEYQAQLFLMPQNNEVKNQIAKTEELLNDMKSFLDSNNIKFAVVLIPLKYQVDDNLKVRFIKNNYDEISLFDMEQPQNTVKEWGLKNNVLVIDLLPKLKELNENNDFYWKLNPHFNIKGNDAVGNIIFDELDNNDYLIKRN